MQVYLKTEDGESGPFSKSEIFVKLNAGTISPETLARSEAEHHWLPVRDILAKGKNGLFRIEEIEKQQADLPSSFSIVPEFAPPTRVTDSPATAPARIPVRWGILLSGIIIAAVLGCLIWKGREVATRAEHPSAFSPLGEGHFPLMPSESKSEPIAPTSNSLSHQEPNVQPAVASNAPPASASIPHQNHESASSGAPTRADRAGHVPETAAVPLQTPDSMQSSDLAATKNSAPGTSGPRDPTAGEIRPIPLPPLRGVDRAIMHIRILDGNPPNGILLICLGRGERTDRVIDEQQWKSFAEEHHLILAAAMVVFHSRNSPGFEQDCATVRKALLKKLADFGTLPIYIYGRDAGGTFALTFANADSPKVASWAVFTDDFPEGQLKEDSRPALIICDDEVAREKKELSTFFQTGRSLEKRWAWLTLASPENERRKLAEDFVRTYFDALLQADPLTAGCWMDLNEHTQMSPAYVLGFPKDALWLPSVQAAEMWKNLMPTAGQQNDPVVVRKVIQTYCKNQPQIEFVLRLPSGYSKDHPPSGTLAFCTWDGDANQIAEQLRFKPDMKSVASGGPVWVANNIIKYAEERNLAVLSWTTRQVWSLSGNTEDLNREEQRSFDQNFDKLASAWEKGVILLNQDFQMPSKDILLYGISRGAQWAHRLALRKPERFLAVHVHIPTTFDTPTPAASSLLWLLTTGEQESGYQRAIRFYQECRRLNYPIIFKAIVDLGHTDTQLSWDLDHCFFDYALKLREERNSSTPVAGTIGYPAGGASADWLKSFRDPPYVADFLNQDIFPSSEVSMVPPALRVAIPTQEIAAIWNSDARDDRR